MDNIKPSSWVTPGRRESVRNGLPDELNTLPNQTKSAVNDAITALRKTENMVQDINNAINEVGKDQTYRSEIGKKAAVYEYAEGKQEKFTNILSGVEDSVRNTKRNIQAKIEKDIKDKSRAWELAESVRNHVKSLDSKSKRVSFVRQQIDKGDDRSVMAVLHGRSFMSGLDDEDTESLLSEFVNKRFKNEQEVMAHLDTVAETIAGAAKAESAKIDRMGTNKVKEAIRRKNNAQKALSR